MVGLGVIMTWHGNNVYVYSSLPCHVLLFYFYSNVYDIEITNSTLKFYLCGFVMHPFIIYGNILVINNW